MLVGIVLGTAAYVTISGLMLGFQTFIIDQLVNNDAQIRISSREELIQEHSLDEAFFGDEALVRWLAPPSGRRDFSYILYPRGWFDHLDADPGVVAYSPQLVVQAIASRGNVSTGARFVGVEAARQMRVTNIQDYMLSGAFADIGASGGRVVVGAGLMQKLGAAVFDTILVSAGKGRVTPFRVVGVFRLGVKAIDDGTIYGALTDAQRVGQTPSRVSDIAVRIADVSQAAELVSTWNMLGSEKVQSWDQANEGIMSVFKTQDIVRNSMTIAILVVAGFGIYNILSMAVSHKRREIAILRSIGYVPGDIIRLFLIQGLILGALGGVIGCFVGYGVCKYLATIPVSPDRGLGSDRMIISFLPMIYVRGFFLAFGSSAAASVLPARAAGRLNPIDIIRGGSS